MSLLHILVLLDYHWLVYQESYQKQGRKVQLNEFETPVIYYQDFRSITAIPQADGEHKKNKKNEEILTRNSKNKHVINLDRRKGT